MPNGVEHSHSVEVRQRIDTVRLPPLHGERITGKVETSRRDSTPPECPPDTLKCQWQAVQNGDTLSLHTTATKYGCELDWWTLKLAPRPVIVRDSLVYDSIFVRTTYSPWLRAGLFAETNILHGLSLADASFGIRGQMNVFNLSLYAQPQYDLMRGFEVKAGLFISAFEQ